MVHLLDDDIWFPDQAEANEDGLLAAGGNLSTERLLLAYKNGIFPWFNEDEPPLWWSPDPRFVLFPEEIKNTKSMKQLIQKNVFEFHVDTAFEEVMRNCMNAKRKDAQGSWISNEVIAAFAKLHEFGYAQSAEAWQNGKLVGGLYGVRMGKIFFGESMFSNVSNASKYAFILFAKQLQAEGVVLIDCQVYTQHLESLGAHMIPRTEFLEILKNNIQ